MAEPALLEVDGLTRTFDVSAPWLNRVLESRPRQYLRAVDDLTFRIERGKTLSLVGESGCGKSTVAKLVVGLYRPSKGEIRLARPDGQQELRVQMIFQDPYASLNPRWRVRDIVAEPLRTLGQHQTPAAIKVRVDELLQLVGLSPSDVEKYPHEFSGGDSGSASRSPVRWPANRSSWSVTSRPQPLMSRSRRKS